MAHINIGLSSDGITDQGWKLYITSLVMIIVAGLFVMARCATRYWLQKLGWDDYTIVVSLAFSIFLSVSIQLAVVNGYGKHKTDLTKQELSMALKWFFIAQTPYKVVVCLNKVSAVLLYVRIFITKEFRMVCYLVMAILVAWSISGIGATIFQCVPIEGSWNKKVKARCINSDKFWIAYAVGNILTDVMVLVLPIPQIFKLHLKLRAKLLLSGVFLMGGFVTVTSVMRATVVSNSLHNKADTTYNFIPRGMWTLLEANAGIISTCLPILKQPLVLFWPRMFGATKDSSTNYYSGDKRYPNRHYQLSDISAQRSKPGLWKDSTTTTKQDTWVSRNSDEMHIFHESGKGSDSEGHTGDLPVQGRIHKKVDLTVSYDRDGANV